MPRPSASNDDDRLSEQDIFEEEVFEEGVFEDGAFDEAIQRNRRPASSPFKNLLLGCGVVFVLMFVVGPLMFWLLLQAPQGMPQVTSESSPESRFRQANSEIVAFREAAGRGNCDAAITMANEVSSKLGTLREALFTKRSKPAKFSLSDGHFLVYCHLQGDHCAFLIHVPDLRKFDNEAKQSLGLIAWDTAQEVVKKSSVDPKPSEIGIGLRGAILYDRAITGTLSKLSDDTEGEGIDMVKTGDDSKALLYHFFEDHSPEPVGADAEQPPPATTEPAPETNGTPQN